MKTSKYLEELKTQSVADLSAQLVEAKKELFNLRLLRKKKLRSRIPERRIVSRGRKKS